MNSDDPKFTAHVLGESEDLTAAERAEIEALLASDPAAATEAAETRALAARLRAELAGEAAAGLEDRQREAVFRAAASVVPAGRVVPFPRRTPMLVAIAAALVVAVTAGLVYRELREVPVGTLRMPTQNLSGNPLAMATVSPSNAKVIACSEPLSFSAQQVQFGTITLKQADDDRVSRPSTELPSAPQIDALTLNSSYAGATAVDAGTINGFSSVVSTTAALNQTALNEWKFLTGTNGRQQVIAVTSTIQTTLSSSLNRDADSALAFRSADANGTADRPVTGLAGLAKREWAAGSLAADASQIVNVNESAADKALGGVPSGSAGGNPASFQAGAEKAFLDVRENPVSTFGSDVGTESYTVVRRYLEGNERPARDAVRIEELLNYFAYSYPPPQGDLPFTATLEVAECPWMPEHRLARIGIRAARGVNVQVEFNPAQVDAYRLLGDERRSLLGTQDNRDRKAAGEINAGHTVTALYELVPAGKELPPLAMLDKLKVQPERQLLHAKDVEQQPDPLSRKVEVDAPATPVAAAAPAPALDGAPHPSAPGQKRAAAPQSAPPKLVTIPAPEPEAQAATLQLLPPLEPKSLPEAEPAPRDAQAGLLLPHVASPESPLRPEAKPKEKAVAPYLVEQEPRRPVNVARTGTAKAAAAMPAPSGREMFTLRLRYKAPDSGASKQLIFPLIDQGTTWEQSSPDFRFAAAVAAYGLLLRDSNFRGQATWQSVAEWAHQGLGADANGRRAEFLDLVEKAKALSP